MGKASAKGPFGDAPTPDAPTPVFEGELGQPKPKPAAPASLKAPSGEMQHAYIEAEKARADAWGVIAEAAEELILYLRELRGQSKPDAGG